MSGDITRFEKSTPVNDGVVQPLTFLDWIKQSGLDITLTSKYESQYTTYVSNWYAAKEASDTVITKTVSERYTTFLKELDIPHQSDEEKRFISNIDYTNKEDLEIAIPYMARAIKSTITSYHDVREDIKYQKIKYSLAGTKFGLEKIIRNIIYNALKTPVIQVKHKKIFDKLPVKKIVNQLIVDIGEHYDLSQDYYDNDTKTGNSTLRERFQNQVFNRKLITDIDTALTNVASQQTVLSNASASRVVTSDLLPLLITESDDSTNRKYSTSDYIDYNITDNSNTNYQTINQLVRQNIGTDLYTITTDANSTYTLSLLSPKKDNNNLLNLYYPTINYIPSSTSTSSVRTIGGFFKPTRVSLQRYYSHDIVPIILEDKLQPNTTYVLPNINVYGNIINNTVSGLGFPIDHEDRTDWVKSSLHNYKRSGYINNSKNHNKFYGYVSTNESQNLLERGLARSTDSYDFWTGVSDDIWNHEDLFPVTNPYSYDYNSKIVNMLPIQSTSELQGNRHKNIVKYYTDIYGNEWFLIKITDTLDRSTRDKLDVTLSTESGKLECELKGGEGFTIDFDVDSLTIDGGTLSGTSYIPSTILTDWFIPIDGVDCTEEDLIRTLYNCATYSGAFFAVVNDSYLYINDAETFDSVSVPSLTANGKFFSSTSCDIKPDTGIGYDIDDSLSNVTLSGRAYSSVFMAGTSAQNVDNSIYGKKNITTGDLWMRNGVNSSLTKHYINVIDFDVYYDVLHVLDNTGSTFKRINNNWTTSEASLVPI